MIYIYSVDGGDVFLVALLLGAGGRVLLLRLNVLEVLGLHVAERLVLQQHVVHELVPLDGTIRVSVNLHEELVELLVRHRLANDLLETEQKLQAVKFVRAQSITSLCNLPPFSRGSRRRPHRQLRTFHAAP